MYHEIADAYKQVTKVSYFLLLVAGVCITGAALAQTQVIEHKSYETTALVIPACSLLASGVAAYVSFMNPALRYLFRLARFDVVRAIF